MNNMADEVNKLAFIEKVLEAQEFDEKNLFISAMIACLSPKLVCNVVKTQEIDSRLKKHILRKIYKDIELKKCLSVYEAFIEDLIDEFYVQYKVAYMLDYIYPVLSCNLKDRILALFSDSYYPSIRNRAYKIIRESWNNNYFKIISNM